jgi:predicted nucleotidyltransferase
MARGNFRVYLEGEEVWVKKYFYVLRPLLAIAWIERALGPVPTEFDRLLERIVEPSELRDSIQRLIEQKRRGMELGFAPRIPLLSDFIERELARLEDRNLQSSRAPAPLEPLDRLFRDALESAWGLRVPPAADLPPS